MIPVGQVVLGQAENRLCLKRGYKGAAQLKQQGSIQIGMTELGDGGSFLCALKPQLALVPPLMQIADSGRFKGAREGAPDAVVGSNLGPVRRQVEGRVRA